MSREEEILVEAVPVATDEVRELISELDRTISAEYSPEQRHVLALDAIFQPHLRFFLARLGGEAVGCGGVELSPDFVEVKRMYVRDAARGKGVAQALLRASRWRHALQNLPHFGWRREIDRKRQYGCIQGRGSSAARRSGPTPP